VLRSVAPSTCPCGPLGHGPIVPPARLFEAQGSKAGARKVAPTAHGKHAAKAKPNGDRKQTASTKGKARVHAKQAAKARAKTKGRRGVNTRTTAKVARIVKTAGKHASAGKAHNKAAAKPKSSA